MKNLKNILLLASILLLSLYSCTFEDVESVDADITVDSPGRINVNDTTLASVWEIEYYKIAFLEIDVSYAPLQYLALYDSVYSIFVKGGDKYGGTVSRDTAGYLEYDENTLWAIRKDDDDNEFLTLTDINDDVAGHEYQIIHLTDDRLVLGDGDNIKAYFSKRKDLDASKLEKYVDEFNIKFNAKLAEKK